MTKETCSRQPGGGKGPKETKGLSVTGSIDPKRILTKGHLRAGDRLILTKAQDL